MSELRFYHLQNQSLEQALPALLSKAYSNGHKIVVRCASEQSVAKLNDLLWTYHPDSFLPHGSAKDGHADKQPIWVTAGNDNPNDADVVILTEGAIEEDFSGYNLSCQIFDGRDDSAVQNARALWKEHKDNDALKLTYWQQNERGGWDKKSES